GAVVIRRDGKPRLRADFLCVLGKTDSFACGIATRACNDGNAPGRVLNRHAQQFAVFVEIDGGRLARGAYHDQGVGALGNMPIDKFSERVEIKRSEERRAGKE